MDSGLIGGIVGSIGGLAGAIFGMWYEARTEAKRSGRKYLTFWPSPVNPWDWRDWINMIMAWVGVISWMILVWCMVLKAEYSIQFFFLTLTLLSCSGYHRQAHRIVDKANAKLSRLDLGKSKA